MKLFYSKNHDGHYLQGVSVVLAESKVKAEAQLDYELKKRGLKHSELFPYELIEIPTEPAGPYALILFDGEY